MKEIALTGTNCHIFADVLSALLHRGIAVHAYVTYPERLMVEDVDLTVSRLAVDSPSTMHSDFEGYHDVVLTFNDDLTSSEDNDFTLHQFNPLITAAVEAGVRRVVVVGSPESAAFFMGDLRRRDGLDWVYISTEGDYAERVAQEVAAPHYHKEEYPA